MRQDKIENRDAYIDLIATEKSGNLQGEKNV